MRKTRWIAVLKTRIEAESKCEYSGQLTGRKCDRSANYRCIQYYSRPTLHASSTSGGPFCLEWLVWAEKMRVES